jgi:hypothetical protein
MSTVFRGSNKYVEKNRILIVVCVDSTKILARRREVLPLRAVKIVT